MSVGGHGVVLDEVSPAQTARRGFECYSDVRSSATRPVLRTTIWADPPKSHRWPPAVRLSRSSRQAARRQKHRATMDLAAQRPRLVNFRRIRIRSVCGVTKVLGAAEAAIMSFLQDLSSLSSEPDSFALIDIQGLRQ